MSVLLPASRRSFRGLTSIRSPVRPFPSLHRTHKVRTVEPLGHFLYRGYGSSHSVQRSRTFKIKRYHIARRYDIETRETRFIATPKSQPIPEMKVQPDVNIGEHIPSIVIGLAFYWLVTLLTRRKAPVCQVALLATQIKQIDVTVAILIEKVMDDQNPRN